MAAYLVLMQQVDDTDRRRRAYVPKVMPLLVKHGGDVLAGGFEGEAAEGEPPNSTVVIRFSRLRGSLELSGRPGLLARERAPVQHHLAQTGGGRARARAGRITLVSHS